MRHPLAEYLRDCGLRVVEVASPADARRLLEQASPAIDIMLADLDADREAGFALAAWTRRNLPEVEVILAGSVSGATAKAAEICEQGVDLRKPYDHRLVLDRIRRLTAARDRRKSEDPSRRNPGN